MERLKIINHQKNRFRGGKCINTLKKEIGKKIGIIDNYKLVYNYELDHIIPYCISENNDIKNLQLLTHDKHIEKTRKDMKILKKLREDGYYERITKYSIELLKPQKEVIAEFIRIS